MISELSIIIPTLNEEGYLPKLLGSIASQNFNKDFEVIVVDGGSKDQTIEKAKKFIGKIKNLQVLRTTKGISHQRNFGVRYTKYKYLMFLDADTFLPENFLSEITNKINPGGIFIANPLILPMDGNIIDSIYVFIAYCLLLLLLRFVKPSSAGMCLITAKANHKKIRGFNEKVVCGEDIDYGFRSIKAGAKYKFYFSPHILASVRRRNKIGRFRLAVTWMRWYIDNITKGPITDPARYKYSFGNH